MPGPQRKSTLAVILGACSWPASQDFQGSEAFCHAANDIQTYLLGADSFELPSENLLNLFDKDLCAGEILEEMDGWIKKQVARLEKEGFTRGTVLFYFVGHADFAEYPTKHCLVVRRTKQKFLEVSAIPTRSLLRCITVAAPQFSQILVFDCCYAAAAYQHQQSGGITGITKKALQDASEQKENKSNIGTYFLCSSGKNIEARIASDGSYPLFSKALIQVLREGSPHLSSLSISDVAKLTEQMLQAIPATSEYYIPVPEYGATNRQRGDIAEFPFFPNLWAGGLSKNMLEKALADFPGEDQILARTILKALIRSDEKQQQVSYGALAAHTSILPAFQQERFETVLTRLVEQKILWQGEKEGTHFYELAGEYLIAEIRTWLKQADWEAKEIEEWLQREANNLQSKHLFIARDLLEYFTQHIPQSLRSQSPGFTSEACACFLRSVFVAFGVNPLGDEWIKKCASHKNPALFKELTDMFTVPLKEEDEEIRKSVATALGKLRDQRVLDLLLAALKDTHKEVRKAAAKALGNFKDERVIESLLTALEDEDKEVRKAAILALREILAYMLNPRPLERLLTALGDEDKEVRKAAIEILGNFKDERVIEPLLAALGDEDKEVRKAAILALREILVYIVDLRAFEPLLIALGDENKEMREIASEALSNFKAVKRLSTVLGDADEKVRAAAARALGYQQDLGAVEPLLVALNDLKAEVRKAVAWALGHRRDLRAVESLKAAFEDEMDETVRQWIESALSEILESNCLEAPDLASN